MWVKRGILEKLFTFVGLVSSFNFKLGKKKKMTRESGTDRVIDSFTNRIILRVTKANYLFKLVNWPCP